VGWLHTSGGVDEEHIERSARGTLEKPPANESENRDLLTLKLHLLGRCRCDVKLASAGVYTVDPRINPRELLIDSLPASVGRTAGINPGYG
jgi:hypothetical protein